MKTLTTFIILITVFTNETFFDTKKMEIHFRIINETTKKPIPNNEITFLITGKDEIKKVKTQTNEEGIAILRVNSPQEFDLSYQIEGYQVKNKINIEYDSSKKIFRQELLFDIKE